MRRMIERGFALATFALAALTLEAGTSPAIAAVEVPSFDCERARAATEIAICRSSRLAALDTAMVALYEAVEREVEGQQARRLERGQLAWRTGRDECGRQRDCIADAYAARIEDLTLILVPDAFGRADRREATQSERERRVREQARRERAAERRAAQERAERERAAQERAAQERAAQERAALEQAERDRAARDSQRRNGFSFERTSRIDGFCSDHVDGRRVTEVQCRAEVTRSCSNPLREESCTERGKFVTADRNRSVTVETRPRQGGRAMVSLNGEPALRVNESCVLEQGGLYGFCFATARGAAIPRRAR